MKQTDFQKQIARKLGIKVEGDSFEMTAAKILDFVAEAVNEYAQEEPTYNQIELAERIGISHDTDSRRTLWVKIAEKLSLINNQVIEKYKIQVGDTIQFMDIETGEMQEKIISTIKDNGRIYFKGFLNNKKAFYAAKIDGKTLRVTKTKSKNGAVQ